MLSCSKGGGSVSGQAAAMAAQQLARSISTTGATNAAAATTTTVKPMIKNRNPMNLEKMRIGFKPSGFPTERRKRNYWNSLDLELSAHHTTATVTHWTGMKVRYKTAIKFMYSAYIHITNNEQQIFRSVCNCIRYFSADED